MADTTTALLAQIQDLTNQKATLIQANNNLNDTIAKETASYNQWEAAGNDTEAHRHSDAVKTLQAQVNGNNAKLNVINQTLPILQAQYQAQVDAQNAANAQAQAQAAVTAAQANLTPDQQYQLQLAQIQAQQQAAATAAAAAQKSLTEEQAAAAAAATKKNWLIGGVIAIAVIIAGFIVYKISK